jgi:hypothetical protein
MHIDAFLIILNEYKLVLGWNSWNHFHCNINENLIQQTADIIVATGLAAAGYQYGLKFYYTLFKYLCSFI